MTTPLEAMDRLSALADELDLRSNQLAEVERSLEPAEREYSAFVDAYEVGLWTRHENGDMAKLPSEALRLKLARAAMPPEMLGTYEGLLASRKRLEKRIAALKPQVDAQRSILSALKMEMEAVR